ncbi:MAG: Wzz/FepE/Etk N-terminal domain-containing protein [Hyphomicrobiales bacterium]
MPTAEPGTMDLRELAAHLVRRSRLIAACIAASLLLAVGYLLIVPAEYLGVASLLIDPNANGSLIADTGLGRAQPDPSMVENQVKLVISDNVLRRVVDHEKLISDIEFGQRPKGIIAQILERLGVGQPASPDDAVTGAVTTLRDHIFTRRSERTFVIDVGVYAREARKSARLTDALAQAFIEEGTAARVAFARQQSDEIRTRLADLKARIETAETRVEQYKTQHNIFDNDGRMLTAQQFTDAERELAQAHLRVVEAKARLDQLRSSLAAGRDPQSLPDALRSPAIERIKTQIADIIRQQANLHTTLGPRHPALLESENQLREARGLLQAELRRIADGARNDYDIAVANEAAQQKRVAEIRAKTSSTNEAMVKMRELQREVEVSQAIYDRFLKASGFVASDQLDTPTARIISAAIIPTRPESPRRLAVLSVALAFGLGLGLLLALLGTARARPASPRPQDTTSGTQAGLAQKVRSASQAGGARSQILAPRGLDPGTPEALEPGVTEAAPQAPPAADSRQVAGEAAAVDESAASPQPETPQPEMLKPPAAEQLETRRAEPQGFQESPAPASAPAEAALPDRFDIPVLAASAGAEASLVEKLRAARENPEALLPHMHEVELNPSSEYSRVARELRRALGSPSGAQPLVIAIVSEMRDCGKSTLAVNLARAFADGGSRVLILDADRRNAGLTQALGTQAPEGTVRLADAMRPVFALDGSWRSGIFLASLALGRTELARAGRRADARMPSFSSIKALADVLIIDTQTGTRGPALGPDLAVGATLILEPATGGRDRPAAPACFARVKMAMGQGDAFGSVSPRRPAAGGA